ncbi:aldo/keto reductase [Candidatus Sumerlaeota bacterium]|nr:aldo/keto reductase [Candidatus Sumerlaeota bacterium]
MRDMDRREFSRIAMAGMAGLPAAATTYAAKGDASEQAATPSAGSNPLPGHARKKVGGLYHRPLGRTGFWISELSVGGSPSPPLNVFMAAIERGVNFCDTSPRYSEGKGEQLIGQVIRGRREQVYVSTKITPGRGGILKTDDAIKQVEGSLKRLGTDYIDILCAHGVTSEEQVLADWVLEAIEQLRKAGKARFFGASVHNTTAKFNRAYIESGHYQVMLIPFNMYFDPKMKSGKSASEADSLSNVLALAAEKGVGVITMKSLAAGSQANVAAPAGISPVQAKLRWVLRHPQVTSILNEMVTFDYLKEDLAASAADLSGAEEAYLRRCAGETADAFCRMCRSCESACPASVPVPDVLRVRMYALDYGDRDKARELAREINLPSLLDNCHRCAKCQAACPWRVRTSELMDDLRKTTICGV